MSYIIIVGFIGKNIYLAEAESSCLEKVTIQFIYLQISLICIFKVLIENTRRIDGLGWFSRAPIDSDGGDMWSWHYLENLEIAFSREIERQI